VVEEPAANLLRDLVTISHRQPPGHRDAHLRVQAMSNPPGPEIGDLFHSRNVTRRVADRLERLRIDPVEHPDHHRPSRFPDDHEDGGRDQQPDDRVGQRVARPDSDGAEEHRQAGPAIHARVVTVGDQRDAADLPTHSDAEDGHGFVRLFSLGGLGSLAPRTRLTTQRPLVQRVAPIIRTRIHASTSNSRTPSARTDILMARRNQG